MLKFDPYQMAPHVIYMGVPIWLLHDDSRPDLPMMAIIDWHGRRQAIYTNADEAAFELIVSARGVIDLLIDIELRGLLDEAGLARERLRG